MDFLDGSFEIRSLSRQDALVELPGVFERCIKFAVDRLLGDEGSQLPFNQSGISQTTAIDWHKPNFFS